MINNMLEEYGISVEITKSNQWETNPNVLYNVYYKDSFYLNRKNFIAQTFYFKRKHSAKFKR